MNDVQIKIAIAFASGICIGGGVGFLIAEKRLRAKSEEEIASVRELYRTLRTERTTQEQADWNPEVSDEETSEENGEQSVQGLRDTAAQLGYIDWEEAKEILKQDPNYILPESQEEQFEPGEGFEEMTKHVEVGSDLPDNPNDPRNWLRDPEVPYVITDEEYRLDAPEHEKLSITYYQGDDTLADQNDGFIPDPEMVILKENLRHFGMFAHDPRVIYVRNEVLAADYEVTLNEGAYSREVMGFDIDDNMVVESKNRMRKMRYRE